MKLSEIMSRRVLILSGKGGVGKSVVSAALAWKAAQEGKRTLLIEMDTMETLPRLFGRPGGERYKEVLLAPNIHCLHVDGKSGLEEYLQLVLKSKTLTQRIFRSPVYEYFVNVAPGLKELMAVGKIWDLEQSTVPGTSRPKYDLFIVDTPATGHALAYLRMPMSAVSTLRRGFVRKEAQKVADLLQDPGKTSFNIVTTPAETPVNEAIELHEEASRQLRLPVGCLFVNQLYPAFFQGPELDRFQLWTSQVEKDKRESPDSSPALLQESALLRCALSWQRRRETQEAHLERLRQALPAQMVTLPLVPAVEDPLSLIQELAGSLQDSVAE
ncbi:MAG: ArsA family ATPase [bacterium]